MYSDHMKTGDLGEIMVIEDLMSHGLHVFKPVTSTCPVDLITSINNSLYKIQVKSTTTFDIRKFSTIFPVESSNGRKNKRYSKLYDIDEIDIFAFVCIANKCISYVPISIISQYHKSITIRYSPIAEYTQKYKGAIHHENYTFEKFLSGFDDL